MSVLNVAYKSYIFAEVDDRQRLMVQHEAFQPGFMALMEQVLDEYGLAGRLAAAKRSGDRVRILDLGCAEGLFLHDLAAVLEKRGLLEAAELNGIDIDRIAIATAEDFSKASRPPRPYLNFFVHDATQPLTDCIALRRNGLAQFDFIYALDTTVHLPNARQHIERLYSSLKPGGVIYLHSAVMEETPQPYGWTCLHPLLDSYSRALFATIAAINPGISVAAEQAAWLVALGAQQVQSEPDLVEIGGETKRGMDMMRNGIMLLRNVAPVLIAQGVISRPQFEFMMATLYRELNRASRAYITYFDTLARRPEI